MKNLVIQIIFPLLFLVCGDAFAEESENKFSKADALYEQGDCKSAMIEYQNILKQKNDLEDKKKILFRNSYCHYILGEFAKAEKGFENYLKKTPDHQEARIRYAQSLFFNGKNQQARQNVQLVSEGNFKIEAQILESRIDVAEMKYTNAVDVLKAAQPNESQAAEVKFWLGMAEYYADQDAEAESHFQEASHGTQPTWLKKESENWLEQIKLGKKNFFTNVSMGAMYDTNLAQGGGTATVTSGGSKPMPTNNYIIDSGPTVGTDFRYVWNQKRRSSLSSTVSLYSPFYNNNSIYNAQSTSVDLAYQLQTLSQKNYTISLKFLESYYNNIYSQGYVSLNPSMSWYLTKSFFLRFSLPINSYLNNKMINVGTFSTDMQYVFHPLFQLSWGASYTQSVAPEAVFSNPPLAVVSGTVFSRYTSSGGSLGVSSMISETFQIGLNYSNLTTNYQRENLPAGGNPKSRSDVTTTYQLSINKILKKDFWILSLNSSYTDNTSNGWPGVATSGVVPNNTYTRAFTTLTTSFYF